jgi:hypothetical protein
MKAGDVFGIKTGKGEAFFQFVRKVAPMALLSRILLGGPIRHFVSEAYHER